MDTREYFIIDAVFPDDLRDDTWRNWENFEMYWTDGWTMRNVRTPRQNGSYRNWYVRHHTQEIQNVLRTAWHFRWHRHFLKVRNPWKWTYLEMNTQCLKSLIGFLSLRVFGLLSSSLLFFPQRFDKHLKKAGWYIGRNVLEIIKMKTIVWKRLMIKINKLHLRNLDTSLIGCYLRNNTTTSLVWFGCVGFYGISTIVGYLMPNPVFSIYIFDSLTISW